MGFYENLFGDFNTDLLKVFDDNGKVIDPLERRIIVVASESKFNQEIEKFRATGPAYTYMIPFYGLGKILIKNYNLKKFLNKYTMYPCIEIQDAKEFFTFPPNHPMHDTIYAMCDLFPDIYVPLSSFHTYFQQMKHSSFIDLCADLGAKEVYLEFAEIDNKSYKIEASSDIPTELHKVGINLQGGGYTNKNMSGKLVRTFPEKNSKIGDYQSAWIDTEPSWKSMIKTRIDNYAETCKAEYSYTDDFGINANVAAKCNDLGLNIGGEFNKMKKIELKYNVIFWNV